jgi:hypothetical protein
VAHPKGAGSEHRGDDGGARKPDAIGKRNQTSTLPHVFLQVTDGLIPVGTVEHRGYFVALDIDGTIIGRFHDLKIAVRALPSRAS